MTKVVYGCDSSRSVINLVVNNLIAKQVNISVKFGYVKAGDKNKI